LKAEGKDKSDALVDAIVVFSSERISSRNYFLMSDEEILGVTSYAAFCRGAR
jgi:hypothetical protein